MAAESLQAKTHLSGLAERTLNDLSNVNTVTTITAARALDLSTILGADRNLFVDDDIVANISDVRTRLSGAGGLISKAKNEIINLTSEEAVLMIGTPQQLTANKGRLDALRARRADLLNITGGTAAAPGTGSTDWKNRGKEYLALETYANYFNRASTIKNIDIDLTVPMPRAGIANINQNLSFSVPPNFEGFKVNVAAPEPAYTLCDEEGTPLPRTGANYTMQIGGQTVTVSGINFVGNSLDLQNITITPANVDLTQPIKLSVNAAYNNVKTVGGTPLETRINVACNKKFELQLRNGPATPPPIPANTPAIRQAQIDDFNNAGNGRVIENSMNANYENNIADIERKAFFRAVAEGDGPKLERLTPAQKEQMYQTVRNTYWANPITRTPDAAILGSGAPLLNNINDYSTGGPTLSFRQRLAADNHEGTKDPKNIASVRAYRNYVSNELEKQITKYFENRFDKVFIDNNEVNTYLKSEVTNYLTHIDENRLDNDMHQDVDNDIDTTKNGNDKMRNRRRKIFGLRIGRRDVNYMRFFSGAKKSISEQEVKINTNAQPEDLNNPQPDKYSLDLAVSGKNHITASIKVAGQPDFAIKNSNPACLVRDILRCPRIQYGKTRAHIAYSVIKGMIEMAKEKDLSLTYNAPNGHNMVVRMDNNNVVLEDQDDQTNFGGNKRRITEVLFDYKLFDNTNTFEGATNRSLRQGIDKLMGHFNKAMNQTHEQYRKATEKKFFTKTHLPTSAWTSPIKKLLNMRTTTNFDFQTTVTGANGKKASVVFKENMFTISGDGIKKPISSKSLGKLLGHREGRMRVFDGIERDICGGVYEEIIKKMRENSKIARSNFGVRDDITKRIYIMDEDGQMGYLPPENAKDNNPIKKRNVGKIIGKTALTGGLIAGGIATGGASAIAATLSAPREGMATATLRGAGAISAIDAGTYITRNLHRDYGIITNPPPGRIMCNASETKELMKNPHIMARMIRAMSERLGRL